LAGIGPREVSAQAGENAVGGDAYAIGSAQVRLPDFLPADYGVGLSLFTDVGTLGHLDVGTAGSDCAIPGATCIKDNMGMRATGGLGISWKSPFGPIAISLAMPYVKQSYDKPQIIYFSAGTGL
jgi:outer membrane protein insertion porin family